MTGDLILQTELPDEEVFLHLKDRICTATGVPNFCQQLMSKDGDMIRDWNAWDRLGQPLNLQVAFQMATKSLSRELLEFSSTGDHDKVQEILQQFQDPNVVDPAGESPIVKVRGHIFLSKQCLFCSFLPWLVLNSRSTLRATRWNQGKELKRISIDFERASVLFCFEHFLAIACHCMPLPFLPTHV